MIPQIISVIQMRFTGAARAKALSAYGATLSLGSVLGLVLGGVIVAPRASELILPLSIAIEQNLSVDQIAHTFSVYPSLSGSVTEAARTVMEFGPDAIL